MPRRTTAALLAALTLTLPAGCGGDDDPAAAGSPAPSATGEPWYDEITTAERDGEVGPAGTPCPLPVTFPLATGWRPETIEPPATAPSGGPEAELGAELMAALGRRGGATLRCEVDGRRRGGGFLRVWTADRAGVAPRAALDAYLADTAVETAVEPRFRDVTAGGLAAVEATWLSRSELLGEENRGWAVAVQADGRTLLFTTNESLIAERTDVLPAYRLAVQGLRVGA
ncbi:lipoprotein [Micromonospora sp. NPDC047707]|uniref:lipoprotein n=1 Tax=Micromonospora sp. NPDC047707 TaxID=3154498 RepID=UPI0034522722